MMVMSDEVRSGSAKTLACREYLMNEYFSAQHLSLAVERDMLALFV
jgi:hypothetical protein